ncbi:MAG: L-histidine N(alpha)-methyltransferase [Gammaproteobacteria bacterium]|jgi:dimethylhistidine N-methyltransferase
MQYAFHDFHPPAEDLLGEVLGGLTCLPKRLPPKFFYDRRGSQLFDAITRLPEYYPTRTEIGILQEQGEAIAEHLGHDPVLIELGSGSPRKIRVLLDSLHPAVYMPVDISAEHLRDSASHIARDYPEMQVEAVCADYSASLHLPDLLQEAARAAFFPGSSIGNFEPAAAVALLRDIGEVLGPGGAMLIGVDLKKDWQKLEAAYNDTRQLTAAFNLNLLTRINREAGADFDITRFAHRAFYNEVEGRIEMHLASTCDQQVHIDGQCIGFGAGETIHTENSYKYSVEEFQELGMEAGYEAERVWTDPDELFSVHCLRVAG